MQAFEPLLKVQVDIGGHLSMRSLKLFSSYLLPVALSFYQTMLGGSRAVLL